MKNNFNLIRLTPAALVILSHSAWWQSPWSLITSRGAAPLALVCSLLLVACLVHPALAEPAYAAVAGNAFLWLAFFPRESLLAFNRTPAAALVSWHGVEKPFVGVKSGSLSRRRKAMVSSASHHESVARDAGTSLRHGSSR